MLNLLENGAHLHTVHYSKQDSRQSQSNTSRKIYALKLSQCDRFLKVTIVIKKLSIKSLNTFKFQKNILYILEKYNIYFT